MKDLSFDLLQQEIEYASLNRDFQGAFDTFVGVSDWLEETNIKKTDFPMYLKYLSYINKLKFICLNYFDDLSDYADLLKNNFSLIFEIPNFNLWDKIELYLITISDAKQRDVVKEKLKMALSHCDNNLFSIHNYPTGLTINKVKDWVKDFVVNLGLDNFDNIKKTEYLMNGKYIKSLKNEDKARVQILLDIYEKLSLSSQTKDGYENSVVMVLNGKMVIFNRGEVEEIKPLNLQYSNQEIISDILAEPIVLKQGSKAPTPSKAEVMASPSQKSVTTRTTELEDILDSYSNSSLEYKAISQEILRLKKAEARKDAKR